MALLTFIAWQAFLLLVKSDKEAYKIGIDIADRDTKKQQILLARLRNRENK